MSAVASTTNQTRTMCREWAGRWAAISVMAPAMYWWKRRYCGHSGSCRKGVWCAPLWCRTRIWGRVTYTTVMEAPTRSMVWMVPLG